MAFDSNAYKAEFAKENYDRTLITMPKGRKDDLKALAKREGMSMNELVLSAIKKAYGLDLSK